MSDALSLPSVFDAFFDDAAIFPPGRAPLDRAVRDHITRRITPLGRTVGPLLLPVDKLDDAAAMVEAAGTEPVRVGVVVPAGASAPHWLSPTGSHHGSRSPAWN